MTIPAGLSDMSARVDVEDLIDNSAITSRQWVIFWVLGFLSMIDGFDLQAIAFAAPEIRREWGVSVASLGPIFSAGLLGSVLGGVAIGPLGDRIGPRRILVACPVIFGSATLATALAFDLVSLGLLRFVAGFGLGAAVPAIVATLSAYAPARWRALVVTGAICVQLLGAVLGSIASIPLIYRVGWEGIFWLGGILPFLLLPFIFWLIPEPLTNLVRRGATNAEISLSLTRAGYSRFEHFELTTRSRQMLDQSSAIALFRDGMALPTSLLMLTAAVGGSFYYFLANWLPTILRDMGEALDTALLASTALNAGGLVGSLVCAWLMGKHKVYKVMTIGYGLGGVFVLAISVAVFPLPVVMVLMTLKGYGKHLLTHVPPCHRIQPDILTGGGDERPEDRLRPGEHIRSECRSPVGRAVARPDFHRQGIGQGHQPPRTRCHARLRPRG